ncbi:sigma-70 family RNA polymerase sigma factor [Derxia lacustris]|uniref:sigma-70 family RNA polymerase sigma factor n=1 Tax=Derxia lacustris TaxID=764842 RepID=UPI001C38DF53|nr:sigma-70 family RNA polymerase sigma factor [Derxia lacustris]
MISACPSAPCARRHIDPRLLLRPTFPCESEFMVADLPSPSFAGCGTAEFEDEPPPEARDDATLALAAALPRSADEAALCGLIARIVERDEQALAELYDATVGRVHGLALRIVRNAQTAEEVAEDTFWQVWRQAPRFDPERGSALAWLLTIARSRALDALRRVDRAECVADTAELAPADADPAVADDPQDLLAATRSGHVLHAALARLDALPRQLIALAFFQGLTHDEIASHTGLPLGTVKSHLRRTLLQLRKTLATAVSAP